ncbi:MAG: hypothetical protein JWO58_1228 [Chitinophagaceae bacterium]|nr:hypothetical protein [Chitinophagaceae bacterium]
MKNKKILLHNRLGIQQDFFISTSAIKYELAFYLPAEKAGELIHWLNP